MARSFNGSSDYIDCGSSATLNPNGAAAVMSAFAWIYPTSFPNSYNSIITRTTGGNAQYFFAVKSNGKLAFYYGDSGVNLTFYDGVGSNTLSANTWYHVGFVVNSGSAGGTGFVNGSSDGTTNAGTGIAAASANTNIGRDSNSASLYFAGLMADVAIWDVVLTAGEIAALAKGVRPSRIRQNRLLDLPLDGLQSPEPDFSGNAFNGTLHGTTIAAGPPLMPFTPRWPQGLEAVAAAPALMGQAML